MKVAFVSDFYPGYPDEFKSFIPHNPEWRWKDAIEYLENHPELQVTSYDSEATYYRLSNRLIKVYDIDISRPWIIANYDGSEYPQYIDYNVVNSNVNLCKFKD